MTEGLPVVYLIHQGHHQGLRSLSTHEILGVEKEDLIQAVQDELQQQAALFRVTFGVKEGFICMQGTSTSAKLLSPGAQRHCHNYNQETVGMT